MSSRDSRLFVTAARALPPPVRGDAPGAFELLCGLSLPAHGGAAALLAGFNSAATCPENETRG
jgi:hypothetical protein